MLGLVDRKIALSVLSLLYDFFKYVIDIYLFYIHITLIKVKLTFCNLDDVSL